MRVVDYLIALSLDLPRALYDSVAMTVFNLITGLSRGGCNANSARARHSDRHRGLQWGAVRLHGREPGHRRRPRSAVCRTVARRHLRQQPRPADHQHVRRSYLRAEPHRPDRHAVHRSVGGLPGAPPRGPDATASAAEAASPEPPTSAAPTLGQPAQSSAIPQIVRLKEDSTTVITAPPTEEFSAPTTALRILRREPTSDTTTQFPTPPYDDVTLFPEHITSTTSPNC